MREQAFYIGDTVEWSSQANGHTKDKTGTVIAVVPAGERPPVLHPDPYYKVMFDAPNPRSYLSYLVEVDAGPKAKPRLYWPVPSTLRSPNYGNPVDL